MDAPKSTTLTLRLDNALVAALAVLASRDRRELCDYVASVLTENALRNGGFADPAEAKRLQLTEEIVSEVVKVALEIVRTDGFSSDITLKAVQRATANSGWLAKYEQLVQKAPHAHGNPRKGAVNRRIGNRIKATLGAGSRMVGKKPDVVYVRGEIIQSFTPLEPPPGGVHPG
jgi:hypothetical protein